MSDQPQPASPSQRRTMYVILGLPVAAVIVILAVGIYAQWGKITPRWKKPAPAAMPPSQGGATNDVSDAK